MKKVKKITLWVVAIVFLCLAILQIYNLFKFDLLAPNNSLGVVLTIIQIIPFILISVLALLTTKVKSGRYPKIYYKVLFVTLFLQGVLLEISGLSFFGGSPFTSKLGIPGASICIVFGIFLIVLGVSAAVLSKTPKEEKLEEILE